MGNLLKRRELLTVLLLAVAMVFCSLPAVSYAAVTDVVINEVQSKDPDGGPDWIELKNIGSTDQDISGLIMKDSEDDHSYTIPDGTTIPAGGILLFKENESFTFGLGKNDSVRLFNGTELISSTSWGNTHTTPSWGRTDEGEYKFTSEATPGEENIFEVPVNAEDWPGGDDVTAVDTEPTFLEDSSGLDFKGDKLYAIDNGTGTFWICDVAEDGTITKSAGYENGRRIRFQADASDSSAAGPDSEGITVADNGCVYAASERDNSNEDVNYDVILKVDPSQTGDDLVAVQEWNITSLLPTVAANFGIESVEWVPNSEIEGKIVDQSTSSAYSASNYPGQEADGLFFVALEKNGHVYALNLNTDGTASVVADIDSTLGGAMALDYDTYDHVLWVTADNSYGNRSVKMEFTGADPEITMYNPPSGLAADTANYEGFAIADVKYTKDGLRPVYRFMDGVASGALWVGTLTTDYYRIDYETNGGTNNTANPAGHRAADQDITLAAPTRAGYTFSGWFTESDFSGEEVTAIPSGTDYDVTLYAKWTAVSAGQTENNSTNVKLDAGKVTAGSNPATGDPAADGAVWLMAAAAAAVCLAAVRQNARRRENSGR